VTNEALWQSVPLQHDRLLQLVNVVELLPWYTCSCGASKWRSPPDLNPGCLWLNEGNILTTHVV